MSLVPPPAPHTKAASLTHRMRVEKHVKLINKHSRTWLTVASTKFIFHILVTTITNRPNLSEKKRKRNDPKRRGLGLGLHLSFFLSFFLSFYLFFLLLSIPFSLRKVRQWRRAAIRPKAKQQR